MAKKSFTDPSQNETDEVATETNPDKASVSATESQTETKQAAARQTVDGKAEYYVGLKGNPYIGRLRCLAKNDADAIEQFKMHNGILATMDTFVVELVEVAEERDLQTKDE